MTLAFVSAGSIPLPQRRGLQPFASETSTPPGEFAGLLATRSGADPTSHPACVATAFDRGRLFGTAVVIAAAVQDAANFLSAVPSPATSAAGKAPAEAEIALLSQPSDSFSLPPENLEDPSRIDRVSDSPDAPGTRSPVSSQVEEPATSIVGPTLATASSLRPQIPAAPKVPPMPRNGDPSMRAAMIERLGPVHVSIQSAGTATHILARVAGVRRDQEDSVARALREVAEAAGVDVETLVLNGTGHNPVKRR